MPASWPAFAPPPAAAAVVASPLAAAVVDAAASVVAAAVVADAAVVSLLLPLSLPHAAATSDRPANSAPTWRTVILAMYLLLPLRVGLERPGLEGDRLKVPGRDGQAPPGRAAYRRRRAHRGPLRGRRPGR